jgi:hypothetical protein
VSGRLPDYSSEPCLPGRFRPPEDRIASAQARSLPAMGPFVSASAWLSISCQPCAS